MNDTYTVWALCYDPEWLSTNEGDPSLLISPPLSLEMARGHARVLSTMASTELEIRDTHGHVVSLTDETTPHEVRVKRARRELGGRGR